MERSSFLDSFDNFNYFKTVNMSGPNDTMFIRLRKKLVHTEI